MELNPDKVRKIVSEIRDALERLEELKRLPQAMFLADPHKIGSATTKNCIA